MTVPLSQDQVQEMVLQIWCSFDRYDDGLRFSTWMYRVALNVAISFYRSETPWSRISVPADDSILEIAAEAPAHTFTGGCAVPRRG